MTTITLKDISICQDSILINTSTIFCLKFNTIFKQLSMKNLVNDNNNFYGSFSFGKGNDKFK